MFVKVFVVLIMKVEDNVISVFLKNDYFENFYNIGDCESLDGFGLYCEYVIKM